MKTPDTKRTQDWLYDQYAKFNKKYFQASLPQDILIQIVPVGRQGYSIDCRQPTSIEAVTTTFENHCERPIIEFSELTLHYPPYAKSVMLHEMIHVAGIQGHGKPFNDYIKKLAQRGALLELLK